MNEILDQASVCSLELMSKLEVTSFVIEFAMFGSDIEAKSNMNDVIPSCTSMVKFKLSTDWTT